MTKKEAMRRLEDLAFEAGRKRNYYVKKALLEFLDRHEHPAASSRTRGNGLSAFEQASWRFNRYQ